MKEQPMLENHMHDDTHPRAFPKSQRYQAKTPSGRLHRRQHVGEMLFGLLLQARGVVAAQRAPQRREHLRLLQHLLHDLALAPPIAVTRGPQPGVPHDAVAQHPSAADLAQHALERAQLLGDARARRGGRQHRQAACGLQPDGPAEQGVDGGDGEPAADEALPEDGVELGGAGAAHVGGVVVAGHVRELGGGEQDGGDDGGGTPARGGAPADRRGRRDAECQQVQQVRRERRRQRVDEIGGGRRVVVGRGGEGAVEEHAGPVAEVQQAGVAAAGVEGGAQGFVGGGQGADGGEARHEDAGGGVQARAGLAEDVGRVEEGQGGEEGEQAGEEEQREGARDGRRQGLELDGGAVADGSVGGEDPGQQQRPQEEGERLNAASGVNEVMRESIEASGLTWTRTPFSHEVAEVGYTMDLCR
nr:hypothetical protein CFP56_52441 [Quercus suber]